MFSDELSKIVDSENQAEEILRRAKAQCKGIVDEAEAKADDILDEANQKSKSTYDRLINEGKERSDAMYEEYLEGVAKECRVMTAGAEMHLNETVQFIVERIVKANVHS